MSSPPLPLPSPGPPNTTPNHIPDPIKSSQSDLILSAHDLPQAKPHLHCSTSSPLLPYEGKKTRGKGAQKGHRGVSFEDSQGYLQVPPRLVGNEILSCDTSAIQRPFYNRDREDDQIPR